MCGIAGFTTFAGPRGDEAQRLARMTEALAHRGPDGQGVYLDPAVALGHRRLSIIDVAGGAQPMASPDGRYHIVYNGEVYNYLELRRTLQDRGHTFRTQSDTEVLLACFLADGPAALQKIDGMFAFAIWDRQERQLFLARDRIGIKPLYFATRGPDLLFASEMKALLAHGDISRELSPQSVSKYFSFGYIPAPHTIFAAVQKLEPGTFLTFSAKGLTKSIYWDVPLQDRTVSPRRIDESAAGVLGLLGDSVRRQLRSDVPVGVFLSGGIDSSAIAALAAQASGRRLMSFSIGFDNPSYDESPYARRVAQLVGTEHHALTVTLRDVVGAFPAVMRVLDEPLADASILPTYLLCQAAARHVKVVLGGDGGDELFAGYPSFQAHKIVERLSFLPPSFRDRANRWLRRLPVSHHYTSFNYLAQQLFKGLGMSPEVRFLLWMGCYGNDEKRALFSPAFQESLLRDDPFEDVFRYVRQSGLNDGFQRLLYLCMKLYFQDGVLVKVDRASMAHSLEVRVPYMDRDLVEYAARIQPFYKLKGLTTKYVLKRAVRGLLPSSIIHRRKAGFMMPVAAWLGEKDLRDIVEDLCAEKAVAETGLFDPAFVRRMLDDHYRGARDHRKQIWPLLCFMAWRRNYA